MSIKKYPLKDILRIRKIKQDAALAIVQKEKRRLFEHIKKIDKQKWRIEQYAKWLPSEEVRLFNKIMKQVVKKDAVSEVEGRIKQHRGRQKEHDERLKKMEDEQKKIEQELEKARNTYQDITSDLEKIDQHKQTWITAYNKEQEELLEKENEDLRKKTPHF